MKDKQNWKLVVGAVLTVKLITGKVVTGKVLKRDGKKMLNCGEIFYHVSAIEDIIK